MRVKQRVHEFHERLLSVNACVFESIACCDAFAWDTFWYLSSLSSRILGLVMIIFYTTVEYVNCLHARFALFGLLVVAALIMSLLYMNSLFAMRFCIVLM